ncbi:unnamed protein product [Bursaphelenchus okinawaensis]|uniref:Uncharacterized protein n=1 Tax=Bursaphelenchus okinawaensis TaxID=465554 RepID=A0A811KQG1_9BILA|nr:unnamed protein product [Bursaphelenchus okinawaensis]CAG9108006.1 unnamed protein product [Bursaphelenchus okinawaensis]
MSSNVRQQTFVENYQDWSVYTSVKPLRNVATFNQLHCRLFWIAIVLAGIGACTYQTVTIVQEYLQYVRNTNVQFQDTIGSTFPAVTICNLNPIRLNALDSISELQKLEAVYQYLTSDAYQEGDDTNSTSDTDDDDGLSKKKREAGFESSKPVQIASKKKDKAVDGYSTIMTRDELYDMPDEHQLISRKKRAADADVYVSGTPCVLTPTVTTTVSPFECNIDVWLTTTAEPTTTIEPTTTDLTTTVEPTTTDLTTTELTTTEASTTIESTTTESTTTESTTTEIPLKLVQQQRLVPRPQLQPVPAPSPVVLVLKLLPLLPKLVPRPKQPLTSTTPKSITTSTTSTSSTTASTTTKSTTEGFDVTSLPIVQTKNYTTSELNELIDYFGLNKSSSRVALEAQVQDLMQTIIANLDPATLESAGYSLGDLVISCSFDTTPCDYENDFTKVTDPDYGNCYTYNANGTHKTARSGSAYGLRLITFSNVSDYLASSSCAGMRITISKQNFAVFPNTYGYDVAVGRYVLVAVGYDDIERLGHPYNNCTQKDDTEGSIYDGYYTYEGCVRTCFQQSLLANCSCVDSRFPKVSEDDVYCSYNNTEEFECYQNYINVNGDYTQTQNCSCASPCSDAQYSAVLTTAAWPTYFPNFTTPQCTGTYPGTDVDCYTAYTENAVAVDVMFANSEYEVTTESPNMNGYDLFRNISGAISLWIGASVITLFELLELLLYLCFSKKLCGPCKPRPDSAFADGSSSNDDIYDNDGDNELPPPIVDGGGMGFNSLDGPFGGDYNPAEGSGARARKVPSRFVSD